MFGPVIQNAEVDSFKMANSLMKEPSISGSSFNEVLDNQIKEIAKGVKEKVTDKVLDIDAKGKKKKDDLKGLPDITKIFQNSEMKESREVKNTYQLLDKFREDKDFQDEFSKGARQQVLDNANNAAGQALIQPIYDQTPRRRFSKAQLLSNWEKYTPQVTEDITKRSVRIDIPLVNDIHALVLRMHPDRSITASLLGSKVMEDLIKQNKDKLDRSLRHHHLSLREFNAYTSEVEFNSESGTKRKKRQGKTEKKSDLDLV